MCPAKQSDPTRGLCDRWSAPFVKMSELLLDRLATIIAMAATLLRKRLVEIIVQHFPTAGGALALEHHLLEFTVFLFVSLFALLDDLVDFAATKICFYEFEPSVANFADHIGVFE